MISTEPSPKPNARDSSEPRQPKGKAREGNDDKFGPPSLFAREPVDFDLITQLTHMSAVATSGVARDKLFDGTANLDYSTSKYFRRVHQIGRAHV